MFCTFYKFLYKTVKSSVHQKWHVLVLQFTVTRSYERSDQMAPRDIQSYTPTVLWTTALHGKTSIEHTPVDTAGSSTCFFNWTADLMYTNVSKNARNTLSGSALFHRSARFHHELTHVASTVYISHDKHAAERIDCVYWSDSNFRLLSIGIVLISSKDANVNRQVHSLLKQSWMNSSAYWQIQTTTMQNWNEPCESWMSRSMTKACPFGNKPRVRLSSHYIWAHNVAGLVLELDA